MVLVRSDYAGKGKGTKEGRGEEIKTAGGRWLEAEFGLGRRRDDLMR